ncbi:hypothetical protein JY651_32715 [Pyxidicoccus parkwayensis]|uniref:Lipoprotein n=1 Tax=Pyxidicoccus parkwayensis TaxID=2813578 RepID=A0ABX7NR32_9BACT|nr:hypothetical protein [Pyxidicoccus parkwaysis]QSQ20020.1 hypothetical protein JY651_32715 [Pyxidicoccus parkwaysis]
MKKALLLPCLLLIAACGGAEVATEESAPSGTSTPLLASQEEAVIQPAFWYTCTLPCRPGYCVTSSIYYPDCAPYGSTTRYTCTPCGTDPVAP